VRTQRLTDRPEIRGRSLTASGSRVSVKAETQLRHDQRKALFMNLVSRVWLWARHKGP
jgi:hypothetical protein